MAPTDETEAKLVKRVRQVLAESDADTPFAHDIRSLLARVERVEGENADLRSELQCRTEDDEHHGRMSDSQPARLGGDHVGGV